MGSQACGLAQDTGTTFSPADGQASAFLGRAALSTSDGDDRRARQESDDQ